MASFDGLSRLGLFLLVSLCPKNVTVLDISSTSRFSREDDQKGHEED